MVYFPGRHFKLPTYFFQENRPTINIDHINNTHFGQSTISLFSTWAYSINSYSMSLRHVFWLYPKMCVKHDSNTLRRATNNNEIMKRYTPHVIKKMWRHVFYGVIRCICCAILHLSHKTTMTIKEIDVDHQNKHLLYESHANMVMGQLYVR